MEIPCYLFAPKKQKYTRTENKKLDTLNLRDVNIIFWLILK